MPSPGIETIVRFIKILLKLEIIDRRNLIIWWCVKQAKCVDNESFSGKNLILIYKSIKLSLQMTIIKS
jgi:hypothetical protein